MSLFLSGSRHASTVMANNVNIAVSTHTGRALLHPVLSTTPRPSSTKARLRCNHVRVQHFSAQSQVKSAYSGYMTLLPQNQVRVKGPAIPKFSAAPSETTDRISRRERKTGTQAAPPKKTPKTALEKTSKKATKKTSGKALKKTPKKVGDPLDELPLSIELPREFRTAWIVSRSSERKARNADSINVHRDSFPTFVIEAPLNCRYFEPTIGKWTTRERMMFPGANSSSDVSVLKPGARIRVVTLNFDKTLPGAEARIRKAFEDIWRQFGQKPEPLVIMLQEMNREAADSLHEHELVRKHFYVSNVPVRVLAPHHYKPYTALWTPPGTCCHTLVSKRLPRPRCSLIQYGSWQFHDTTTTLKHALITDFPVYPSGILRLVNTHLTHANNEMGRYIRSRQLRELSVLVNKSARYTSSPVVAGLVGGDFNFHTQEDMLDCLGRVYPPFKDARFGGGTRLANSLKKIADACGFKYAAQWSFYDRLLYTGHIGTVGKLELFEDLTRMSVDCVAWELTKSNPSMPPYYITDHLFEKHGHNFHPIRFAHTRGVYTLPAYRTCIKTPVIHRRPQAQVFELGNYLGASEKESGTRKAKRTNKSKRANKQNTNELSSGAL